MRRIFLYILFLTAAAGCKERYELPYSGPTTGYLVVDGVINSGPGATIIRLSRTLALVDSVSTRWEMNAAVWVEGENNTSFLLSGSGAGIYSIPQLNLQNNVKYRLRIHTADGRKYVSAYSASKRTPPIDDINWVREEDGMELFINTHDPQNNTLYYKWDYEETWEYHSYYSSTLDYLRDPTGKPYDLKPRDVESMRKLFYCWSSERSSALLIGSSAKLSRDTIHLPLLEIPLNSWKISVLYSVLVRQHALSRAGYEFLQRMKKNTEQVGSLFDAQPSQISGNIECESDPREMVIGYVEVSEAREKRIFIKRNDVLPWTFRLNCEETSLVNHPDSLDGYYIPTLVHLTNPFNGRIARYYASTPWCVECTSRGGSNVKPSYWP